MPVSNDTFSRAIAAQHMVDELGPEFAQLGNHYSGKVRENFSRDGIRTIIVTDRVSAFDVNLGTIPFKGQVLNGLARYWFDLTRERFPNHVVNVPDPQATRAVECDPIPVEFVVRGYLTGSSRTSILRAYERGEREFCGHRLADNMKPHQKLPENIVTPSTKAPKGEHDESVSRAQLIERGLIEAELFDELAAKCLDLFALGQQIAAERGMILVDTKYELGRRPDGEIVLIDEIHTPDSSRYWFASSYEDAMSRGEAPKSLDKEFLRRWLVSQGWEGDGTPPPLTDEVRIEAARRYVETYERLTGAEFVPDVDDPVQRLQRNLEVRG
ncbi:MAG: phosphoribosylaminoimidazolesuccinocarboxamide synthase [Myxococcales bacterium FL481]|nr:MAG: phosphoribosylaminoimidazolesuccinocarboxamide synthase [Myxococcales bacterium FL481]